MKKNFFKEMFISAVAPIVKLFPLWAVKHTIRSNPYAYKFQLSHKREMEVINRIFDTTNRDGLRWLSLHLWHQKTRIACLKDVNLWLIFIDDIRNSAEFKAAYGNVKHEAVAACTKYTLSKDEVVMVCNDTALNIELLLAKQPESFSPEVVKQIKDYGRAELFRQLFVAQKMEMLQSLDTILYQDADSGIEDLKKIAKNCLGFLLRWNKYVPNLEPKQLVDLPAYKDWEEKANPVVVASQMAEFWKEGQNFGKMEAFAAKLAKVSSKDARGEAKRLVDMLPSGERKTQAVKMLINNNIAMPQYVGYFFQKGDIVTFEINLDLCQYQHMMGFIPRKDIESLPERYQEQILIALAKENFLPQEMFDKASPELKTKLFDIIEENAQMKWFEEFCMKAPDEVVVTKIANLRKISGGIQDMALKTSAWAKVFAKGGFFDEKHIIKLMRSGYSYAIGAFAEKHGLTKEHYTALLFGKQASMAPNLEPYIKK